MNNLKVTRKTFSIIFTLIIISYLILSPPSQTIKIANWNLQTFGQTKASNTELMNFYADKIDDYDIIFIQEIRDVSETAFPKLCSLLQNYTCKLSSRAGTTNYKEQYGIIYKEDIILTDFKDYNPNDWWERPPIKTTFKINEYALTTYNIHTKPDNVQQELYYLEQIVSDNNNVLIIGDLNADCSYYNNDKETEFDNWNWIIEDNQDTTVSTTNCAYDRIILNNDAKKELADFGIEKKEITSSISDHYLVWVELKI